MLRRSWGPRLVIGTLVACVALIHASSVMHLLNAGFGAPDWPASYGRVAASSPAPTGPGDMAIAPSTLAGRIHRAVANVLQVCIIAVVVWAFGRRRSVGNPVRALALLALVLSLLLAFLGAWFGSPLQYPWIVIVNLMGGFGLLSIFWWLTLELTAKGSPQSASPPRSRPWIALGLIAVSLQIFLGAWVDAYYAALACTGLSGCGSAEWSVTDLWQGLGLLGHLDVDAAGKVVIDPTVAASVHMTHRLWGLVTLLYLTALGLKLYGPGGRGRRLGFLLLATLALQAGLGAAMVHFGMPLIFVLAHTVTAALFVLILLALLHRPGTEENRGPAIED